MTKQIKHDVKIDWTNLKRDYSKEPLKRQGGKLEDLSYEEMVYLLDHYSFCEITKLLIVSDGYLQRMLKKYNLKTKKKHGRFTPKPTKEELELQKYGALGLTRAQKLNITIDKLGREEYKKTVIENYKKAWQNRTPEQELERQKKIKRTKLLKYGNENYNNKEKRKQTNLKKHGLEYCFLRPEVLVRTHSSEVIKKANASRKIAWDNKTPEEKKLIFEKVQKTKFNKPKEELEAIFKKTARAVYEARKRNGTLSTSRNFEDKLVQYLRDTYPEYTILTQYKEERYPFHCDCYIKELDLFIEFQGSFYHNYRPFNGSPEHIFEYEKMLTKGKVTKGIAKVWRYKDVEKRELAKKNGLNFLEYWELGYLDEVDVSEYDPIKRWRSMCILDCA